MQPEARRYLYRGTAVSFVIRVGGVALLFAGNVMLARALTTTDYGYYAYVIELVALLSVVVSLGFNQIAVRVVPDMQQGDAEGIKRFGRSGLVITIGSVAVLAPLLFVAWRGGAMPPGLSFGMFVLLVGLLLALGLLRLVQEILRGGRRIAGSQLAEQVVWPTVLLGVTLLALGGKIALGPEAVVAVQAAVYLLAFVVLWKMAGGLRAGGGEAGAVLSSGDWRHWLAIGWPLAVSGLFSVFLKRGDVVALGIFVPPEEIAPYAAAVRIAGLMVFGLAAANAASAALIRSYWVAGDRVALQGVVDRSAAIALVFSLPLAIAFLVLPRLFLGAFGSDYVAGETALRLLVLGQLVNALTGPVGPVAVAAGLERLYMGAMATVAILMALALPLVITSSGGVGAAGVTAAAAIALNVWLATVARRRLGLRTYATPASLVATLRDLFGAARSMAGRRGGTGNA